MAARRLHDRDRADRCPEPRLGARAGLRQAGCHPSCGQVHPEHRQHQDPPRQPLPRGLGREDHRKGGHLLHGRRQLLRRRDLDAQGPGAGQDQEGRLHRHPLRGAEGWPRHARDADADQRHHGRGPRQARGAHDRRPLLRRLPRLHHRARVPGGPSRRRHRADRERRQDHGRRRQAAAERRHLRRGAREAQGCLEAAAPARHRGLPLQVREARELGEPGLHDGQVIATTGGAPGPPLRAPERPRRFRVRGALRPA
mmetsp:Transcript_67305/g.197595  ORF Transcript_67305/g.197595 Transcript_67305/m.197595 type:complete len:255 (+) Transcript_67305:1108-1872(+)